TLAEEETPEPVPNSMSQMGRRRPELVGLSGLSSSLKRLATGTEELNRVMGCGLAQEAAVLVGGDPGIGKPTLVLQAGAALAAPIKVAYVSGEQSVDQIRFRAVRPALREAPIHLTAATSVSDITATFDRPGSARLLTIDLIQTMSVEGVESALGPLTQIRTGAHELIRIAKRRDIALTLIGHVTKDGQIAGPRVPEHMVDAVLYFEGERGQQFRILRTAKDLRPRQRDRRVRGVHPRCGGSRNPLRALPRCARTGRFGLRCSPALKAPARCSSRAGSRGAAAVGCGTPRHAARGAGGALEERCGLAMGGRDVYLNVAGGLRIAEPAADLAVAAALVSSLLDVPAPTGLVTFGEIGLAGEIRADGQVKARLEEAARLGFATLLASNPWVESACGIPMRLHGLRHSAELVEAVGVEAPVPSRVRRTADGRPPLRSRSFHE
ncbi:MAG: AAA family ATPase, partial [Geminicoccaceae bacterium]